MLKKIRLADWIYILLGGFFLGIGTVLAPINHYAEALVLMLGAIILYFYIVIYVAEKNWLDIRAVFTGAWLFTIGLAALRLMDYQEPWQSMTWIYNAIAYIMFQIGGTYGVFWGEKLFDWISSKKTNLGRIYFELREKRLYWICIGITLFGLLCFLVNVYIKGYIPFFSTNDSAYVHFYTKFYLFSVASTMISGLCYYCLKTQNCNTLQKITLWICILYETFLFPTLVVSRGAFLTSALLLATTIFYLHGRKLTVLVLSLVLIMGTYLILSSARGYTEEQLNAFFEPSQIVVVPPSASDDKPQTNEGEKPLPSTTFTLSGKAAFLYSYLTVSHDNFNEAVENTTEFTYGVAQLAPMNVILRIDKINDTIYSGERYLVRPHLNTVNLIGGFYYDLHVFGVAVFMLLWGCIFCIIQSFYLKGKGAFALWALGNTMTPVIMCFFACWMEVFSHWMHWGLAFLAYIIASINVLHVKEKK